MEQFSLEKYLKDPDRKVVTREGRPVRIICTDANREETPVVALVKDKATGYEAIFPFSKRGKYYACSPESDNDLFFAPTKHTDYINLYHNEFGYFLGDNEYRTEEVAKKVAAGDEEYVTTIKAEWEE